MRARLALIILAIAMCPAARPGSALAAADVVEMRKLAIVLEAAPGVAAKSGPVSIELRLFEGENPDAPPQVTNIAIKSVAAETLALPMTVEVEVPAPRLAGTLQPMVGVLVLAEGRMAFWNDSMVPLARSGATTVRLSPVP
jgi:hypothetical protein